MKKTAKFYFIYLLIIISFITFPLFSGKVDKIVSNIIKGNFEKALKLTNKIIPSIRNSYQNSKDSMKPKKQKIKCDKFLFTFLLKGYIESKLNYFSESEMTLKRIGIFYDSKSFNQYLFKAYALKLLANIEDRRSNFSLKEQYLKNSKENFNKYKIFREKNGEKYEKILFGFMGIID